MNDKEFIKWMAFPGILFFILIAGGCPPPPPRSGDQQTIVTSDPKILIETGRYSEAKQAIDHMLRQPGHKYPLDTLYYLSGLCNRNLESNSAHAIMDFNRALQHSSNTEVVVLANIALGHIYFEASNPEYSRAIQCYRNALKSMGQIPPKDLILYRTGKALQNLGQFGEGQKYYDQCIKEFPNSTYAEMCRNNEGAEFFAIQLGVFSTATRANQYIQAVSNTGLKATSVKIIKNGKTLYAVRSGRFNTQDAANAALLTVRQKCPDAIVTPSSK